MLKVERLDTLLMTPEPQSKQIIGSGVLLEQTKAVLYGVFKAGKSTVTQYIGQCVAGGIPLFGERKLFPTHKCKVLYVQMEIPRKALKFRRLANSHLSQVAEVRENFYACTEFWMKLDTDAGVALLEEAVRSVKPELVILDPFYKAMSGSENNVEDVTRVFDNIDVLMNRYDFAFLFTAQGRKTQIVPKIGAIDLGDEELRGTGAIAGWVDSIIGLRRGTGSRRHLNFTLRNGDKETLGLTVDWDRSSGLYSVV